MDLRRVIDQQHNKSQCSKIVDYVGNSPRRFKELVEAFLSGPYRQTQRAAWPLSICVERHPHLVRPHLARILSAAARPGRHDAVRRNAMRLLQYTDVPSRLRGKALDLAFAFLQDRKQPIAVRVFSMTAVKNLVQNEPDLRKELRILLEDEMPYGSAAFRSRSVRTLRELARLEKADRRNETVASE